MRIRYGPFNPVVRSLTLNYPPSNVLAFETTLTADIHQQGALLKS